MSYFRNENDNPLMNTGHIYESVYMCPIKYSCWLIRGLIAGFIHLTILGSYQHCLSYIGVIYWPTALNKLKIPKPINFLLLDVLAWHLKYFLSGQYLL